MFVYTASVTDCVGRNDHRLFVPQINTNYGMQSRFVVYYRGETLWNALPMALHNSYIFIYLVM